MILQVVILSINAKGCRVEGILQCIKRKYKSIDQNNDTFETLAFYGIELIYVYSGMQLEFFNCIQQTSE